MIKPSSIADVTYRSLNGVVAQIRQYWLWVAVFVVSGAVFIGSPGDYAGTSHAILHGLCAQTPSHTISFGDRPLPFDSRMTGIYGGFLATLVALGIRGTIFLYGNPPRAVIALLSGFVGLMAMDGLNSLLDDLGLWNLYQPMNALRIVTGYGTGVALAVALCWLLASSVWNMSRPGVAIARVRDFTGPAIGLIVFGAVLVARPAILHLPVSILLVVSAWVTVSMLMLVIVLLAFRLDSGVRSMRQLHVPVAISALLAISVMLALAGARFWMERTFGITNAMM